MAQRLARWTCLTGATVALLLAPCAVVAQISDGVVRIGVLNDQTGPYADAGGQGSVTAAKMAVEDFGGTVLGKPIDVIFADHQNKTDVGANIATRWVDVDGVDLILDVPNSAVALAVQEITRQKNRVFIIAGAVHADPERAKSLFRSAGYDGQPIVILDPVDIPSLHAAMLTTAERLRGIGVNADVQAMDASTMMVRRMKPDPVSRGGWQVASTQQVLPDVMTPAVNTGLAGAGEAGLWGWHGSEQMAKLRLDWTRLRDQTERKRVAEQLQVLAYDEIPYVPWGQYRQPSLHRKSVKAAVTSPVQVYWNIWLDT